MLLQESGAKRQRPEEGSPADGSGGEQGAERAAAASDEPEASAFASAGAQDVSTINDTGDTMPHVQAALAAQVRQLFIGEYAGGVCECHKLDVSLNAIMCKARFRRIL